MNAVVLHYASFHITVAVIMVAHLTENIRIVIFELLLEFNLTVKAPVLMMTGPRVLTRARHLLLKYICLGSFKINIFTVLLIYYSRNVQIACVCWVSLSKRRKRWFDCLPLPRSRPHAQLIIKILSSKLYCLPACQYSSLSLWLPPFLSLLFSLTHAYINSLGPILTV